MNHRHRPRSGFPAVVVAPVEGITVGTHALTAQAEQLQSLTLRVGKRLSYWLRKTNATMDLPPEEWIEVFRYYQAALLGLLKEQRERAKMQSGDGLTDEQLKDTFKAQLVEALETFSATERSFALKLWDSGTIPPTTNEVQ